MSEATGESSEPRPPEQVGDGTTAGTNRGGLAEVEPGSSREHPLLIGTPPPAATVKIGERRYLRIEVDPVETPPASGFEFGSSSEAAKATPPERTMLPDIDEAYEVNLEEGPPLWVMLKRRDVIPARNRVRVSGAERFRVELLDVDGESEVWVGISIEEIELADSTNAYVADSKPAAQHRPRSVRVPRAAGIYGVAAIRRDGEAVYDFQVEVTVPLTEVAEPELVEAEISEPDSRTSAARQGGGGGGPGGPREQHGRFPVVPAAPEF